MSSALWSPDQSRQIVERIVVEGTLVLDTPAHFGAGDDDGAVMSLLVDPLDGESPLLTGASIAGALRSYLWSFERGYGLRQSDKGSSGTSTAALLFGTSRDDDRGEGDQSRLIVDDALGKDGKIIYRDGVRLDESSRTAADKALYGIELWDAGARFPLRFELLMTEQDQEHRQRLVAGLGTALVGLSSGDITLGARKRRGYGRVHVEDSRARSYAVNTLSGVMEWLRKGAAPLSEADRIDDLYQWFGLDTHSLKDIRKQFVIDVWFTLDGSLLIRSADDVTDMKHLSTSDGRPLLSGTSIAGALRARAMRIVNTLTEGHDRGAALVNGLFGSLPDPMQGEPRSNGKRNDKPVLTASHLVVEEHVISGGVNDLVQNRVSIDRFTGGALDGALFNQQPLFGSSEQGVHIRLILRGQQNANVDAETGLLLLLLKDLWTGDLTLGGERSVGRGRLRGRKAELSTSVQTWTISDDGSGLSIVPDAVELETYVQALLTELEVTDGTQN